MSNSSEDLPAGGLYARRPLIFGHRGASAYAPENTLPAFSLALEQGADGFELDVALSADGVPVVLHDDTLQRTTSGSGLVSDKALAELQSLDCGYAQRFGTQFSGVRLPTLAQVFEAAGHAAIINVELKRDRSPGRALAERVVELIAAHNMRSRVIISSFQFNNLQRVKQLDPELAVGALYTLAIFAPRVQRQVTSRFICEAHHPNLLGLSASRIGWLHDHGCRVNAWTVNDPADLRKLMAAGIDGVITDVPDVAVAVRAELAQEAAAA